MARKNSINSEISFTYIVKQRKLTLIAALGVTIGISIFIFMNSLTTGFDRKSNESIFKNSPHIRVYKDDNISQPLIKAGTQQAADVIVNPKVIPETNRIVNPQDIADLLRKQPDVKLVTPTVAVSIFYNNGKSQIAGNASGVIIDDADQMFSIQSLMVEGDMESLKTTPNGILLGVGIADKMSAKPGDNISVTSSENVTKVMKVVGLFQTNNSVLDKTKSYINISAAQQLENKNASYVSDINVSVNDFNKAQDYSKRFSHLTGYKAEDWKAANETVVAASRMRTIIITAVSFSILLVAGFGIYNILNMTISQKLNDIAILKAMGFKGKDVIRIFVQQALIIGLMGILIGLGVASLLVWRMAHVFVGGDIGYFPIRFEPWVYLKGSIFGLIITLAAGYIPAKKAANVDPVAIFRK
ncbi:ABC transporter permease [Deminuibacter soli]|uniref:ABC transporter permease n=1 Tax=Deminuibacter soli TaxID=2291815 RepID=A0A3E1NH13_9BACT|nr:FtsX-like permease family protein [Deminuibacter soli]RFM27151.1 ABC transporter permease [Deminuibacter soli]